MGSKGSIPLKELHMSFNAKAPSAFKKLGDVALRIYKGESKAHEER